MNTMLPTATETPEDRFGHRVAGRLDASIHDLPRDVAERLRAARVRAVARGMQAHRLRMAPAVAGVGRTATLASGWWTRVGAIVPLVVLVAGLVAIKIVQDDERIDALAEIDVALLTDALPPAAYADPGFAQFLKIDAGATGRH